VTTLLAVDGLGAGYGGAPVLRDVSLRVRPATIVAVVGSGKTTLLRVLCGLLPPAAGTISFDGQDLARMPVEQRVRLGIACVPQGRAVVEELTVAENLRLGGLWRGRATDAAVADVYDLFEPLARRRGLAAHHLSGGERQMLAIGRALVAGPRLLLLDEPTAGLAPSVAERILAQLRTLRDTTGLAVLVAAQGAPSIADSVVTLNG
jgi:branched-chain amino acid transport system ATP-binding protein